MDDAGDCLGRGRLVERQAEDLAAPPVPVPFAGGGIVVPAAQAGGVDGDAQVGLGGLQGRLDPLALGDVDHHAAMPHGPALGVALDPAPGLDPFHRAVRLEQAVFLQELSGGLQGGPAGGQHARKVIGMDGGRDLGERHAFGGAVRVHGMKLGVARVGVDLVGGDIPVPGAYAAGGLQGQLIALLAGPQRLLGPHATGGLGQDDQHAAHAGGGAGLGEGAEADGEIALGHRAVAVQRGQVQVLDQNAEAAPGHDLAFGPFGVRGRGRRGLGEALAQGARMPRAQHRSVGVVIDQHQLWAPAQGHREVAGDDHLDREAQAVRPGLARTQRRRRPVERVYPPAHVVAGRLVYGVSLITGIHHARVPSRPYITVKVQQTSWSARFQAAPQSHGIVIQRKTAAPAFWGGSGRDFMEIGSGSRRRDRS